MADELGVPLINVNLSLSAQLLELTARQRALRLPEVLERIIESGQSIAVLDNIEILFDPELNQDPLRLLQGISRNRPVVASWFGQMMAGRLVYAEPGHREYRSYDSVDAMIVFMDQDMAPSLKEEAREVGKE